MAHSVTRIRELIYSEVAQGVRSEHIFLAGFSQGAHLAFATAYNTNLPLAGILSFSGFYSNPHRENAIQEIQHSVNRNLPIWMSHGLSDSVILFRAAECTYDALSSGGARVSFHQYKNMEHIYHAEQIRGAGQWICSVMDDVLPQRCQILTHQMPNARQRK